MKKILISSFIVLVSAVVVVGATRAYFSDTETSVGNSFTAGTLVIGDNSEAWMKGITFSNVKPGDRVRKWVVLRNDGSLDIDYLTVTAVNKQSSDPSIFSQMIVSATGRVGDNDPAYFTSDWITPPTVDGWFNSSDMLDHSYYRTPAGIIHPGESYTMSFDFIVPTSVGNEYQGATGAFDMLFTAEQVHP